MRDDMSKIFHEPGREGGLRTSKGGKRAERDITDGITFEPMRRDRDSESQSSFAPLRRFLISQVGKAWNEVFSEICFATRSGSRRDNETREAIERMVETSVTLVDGKPHDERGYAIYAQTWSPVWVHPETNVLMRSPQLPKRFFTRKPTFEQFEIDANNKLVKIDGLWFVVSFEPLPEKLSEENPERDIVLKQYATIGYTGFRGLSSSFQREWGGNIYAVAKRQANKREIKKYVAD